MLVFILLICINITLGKALTPDDYLITDLPLYNGTFNSIPFKQYSGYISLSDDDETSLFFWFVESQQSPSNDPLVLWTNGGPGASSIDYGFWVEHGPFRFTPNATMVNPNPYSWNKLANMIYLESPSGVGFSFSNKESGYNCTDNKTAHINYLFLKEFLSIFTDFQSNDLYLIGESYSGHYTPQLAQYIIDINDNQLMNQIKGIVTGNPRADNDGWTGPNFYSYLTYLWSHGLIPQTAYTKASQACNWKHRLTDCNQANYYANLSQECIDATNEAQSYIPEVIDLYDIYAPTCHNDSVTDNVGYNPCMEYWNIPYMNREDVLKSIHADKYYSRQWPDKPSNWVYGSQLTDVTPLYLNFINQGWRVLVYDADADTAEPFIQELQWINCLNRTVTKDWFNWYFNKDVAGSIKVYNGIYFQTIKHCGHLLPAYCPVKAYEVFYDFIYKTYD